MDSFVSSGVVGQWRIKRRTVSGGVGLFIFGIKDCADFCTLDWSVEEEHGYQN